MSNRDERDDNVDVKPPKPENWRQRHGTVLFLAVFFLLIILMAVYEKLSH